MSNLSSHNPITGKWEDVKVSTKFKELLNTVTLTEDSSYIDIGISNFNPLDDVLHVYKNTTFQAKDGKYILNTGLLRIEALNGDTWKSGDRFDFTVLKNVDKDLLPLVDPSLLPDGGLPITKFASELQGYLNKIGTDSLDTNASDLSGAVNEVTSQLADITLNIDKYIFLVTDLGGINEDWTPAFNQALIDIQENGELLCPLRDYKIKSTIIFKLSKIKIKFKHGARLLPQNCNGIEFGDESGVTRYNDITLDNIYVDMTNALTYKGITSHKVDEVKFNNTKVVKGVIGYDMDYSYNITFYDCIAIMQTVTNVLLRQACDKTTFIRGQFGNGEIGVKIQGGKGITFIGTSIERNNAEAVRIEGSSIRGLEYPDGINFIGCYFERNCMVSGNAFIHLGINDATISEYLGGVNFVGNYFNWDAGNPRNPIVPIYYLDKCTDVTFIGNRYKNTTTYATVSANANKKKIVAINDSVVTNIAKGITKGGNDQYLIPFNVSVTTDASGYGYYTYSTGDTFVSAFATGTINSSSGRLTFDTTTPNSIKVIVNGATASSTINVTGLILGRW